MYIKTLTALTIFHTICMVMLLTIACNPPKGTKLWNPNPEDTVHEVIWGYANTTYKPCDSNVRCNKIDDSVPVQLQPLEVQLGSVIRFTPSTHQGIPFPIKPVLVDRAGFLSCNASGGQALVTSPTNETIQVPINFLSAGAHYFIEDSDGHSMIDCVFGLRVKVIVKVNNCGSDDPGLNCSGRGLCATNNNQTDYRCLCCGTYEGESCEIFNPCLNNPCGEGGQCHQLQNGSVDFTCECSLEYYGEFCENKRENLCDVIKCQNNGVCIGNSTSFSCACPEGLTGTHCEVDENECASSPCVNGACVDERGGFQCHCKPGYFGKTCYQHHRPCSLSPCHNHGYCQDITTDVMDFRFVCHCVPGWAGKDCSVKVDACSPDTCSRHGTCHEDSVSGFKCSCQPGFTGTRCEININDCSPNPCKHGGHCRDGINTHTCLCVHSHMGSNCQYRMDVFTPLLDDTGTAEERSESRRDLYIVAICLSAVVVVALAAIVICYCRVSGAYRKCCNCWSLKTWRHYRKQRDSSLTVGVDVSSASDCPLAIDSFGRGDGSTGPYSRLQHGSFENQAV